MSENEVEAQVVAPLPEQLALDEQEAVSLREALRDQERRAAYAAEADPLFFKWQRGEASEQDWLDKVQEVKMRYADAADTPEPTGD